MPRQQIVSWIFVVLLATAVQAQEEDTGDEDFWSRSHVSTPVRIAFGIVYIAFCAVAIAETVYLFRKKSDLKLVAICVATFASIKSLVTFIPDSAFFGHSGIALLFINIIPEVAYAATFASFLSFWGYALAKKRRVVVSATNTDTTITGMLKEFVFDIVKNSKTKEGIFFIASFSMTILLTLIAVIVGGSKEMVALDIYFTYVLMVISSGIALSSSALFANLYKQKFKSALMIGVVPLLRMVFSFITVVKGTRLGGSLATVSLWFLILTILFDMVPMVVVVIGVMVLSKSVSALSGNKFFQPMLGVVDEAKLTSSLGVLLDEDFAADVDGE